jgi:hypothetical protein
MNTHNKLEASAPAPVRPSSVLKTQTDKIKDLIQRNINRSKYMGKIALDAKRKHEKEEFGYICFDEYLRYRAEAIIYAHVAQELKRAIS